MDPARPQVNAARHRRRSRAALALLLVLVVPACSIFRSPVIARGNRPTPEQIADVQVGVHTRNDVQALLGSPTASSTFGDSSWYYISSRTRVRPMRHFGISDPETVAVDFDGNGVVREVRVLTEADMPTVNMVSRETPTPGNERTLLQALFGNIGRVGTGGIGAEQSPGPPAQSSR